MARTTQKRQSRKNIVSRKLQNMATPSQAQHDSAHVESPVLDVGQIDAQSIMQLQRQVGNRGVVHMLKGQGLPPVGGLQRNLMPLETFIKASTIKKWRSAEIEEVDKALAEYHSLPELHKTKPYAFFKLRNAIRKYKAAHTDKKTGETKSGRMEAIETLEKQIDVVLKSNKPQLKLWSPSEFDSKTEQKRKVGKANRSGLQVDIINMLHKFWRLPDPMGKDIEMAIPLLYEMREYVTLWQEQYQERSGSNREDRAAGLAQFLTNLNETIETVQGELDVTSRSLELATQGTNQGRGRRGAFMVTPQMRQQAIQERVQEIRDSYRGNAKSLFGKIGSLLLDAMAGKAGDKLEIDLAVEIPVDPDGVGFVGGRMVVKAEKDRSVSGGKKAESVKIRAELMLTGGVKVPKFAMLRGELGGYFEAQGRTAQEAMKLVSYGFYRRLRESKAIPNEVANFIWGGRASTAGFKLSEKWAGFVEKEAFGGDGGDKNYVETGGLAGVTGELELSKVAKIGGNLKATTGTRYDKAAVTKGKAKYGKKLGEALDAPSRRFESNAVGQSSTKFEAKVSASALGFLSGDFKIGVAGTGGKTSLEIEGNGMVKIPLGTGLVYALNGVSQKLFARLVDVIRELGGVGDGVKVEAGDFLAAALKGKGFYDVLKSGVEIGEKSTMNVFGATMTMLSESGINLSVKAKYDHSKKSWEVKISVELADDIKVDVSVLKAKVKMRKRIVGFLWKTGQDWQVI